MRCLLYSGDRGGGAGAFAVGEAENGPITGWPAAIDN
jgi:hypothetical protein